MLAVPVALLLILALAGLSEGAVSASRHSCCCCWSSSRRCCPRFRSSVPWLAALHPVNALALMGVTGVTRGSAGRASSIDNPLAEEWVAPY